MIDDIGDIWLNTRILKMTYYCTVSTEYRRLGDWLTKMGSILTPIGKPQRAFLDESI